MSTARTARTAGDDDAVDLDAGFEAGFEAGSAAGSAADGARPPAGGPGLGERLLRWPDGAPAWLRGPGAAALAAVAAAGVTGALVARHAEARLDERVADRTALLALSVAAAEVEDLYATPFGRPARDEGARPVELSLTLVNRSDQERSLRVSGLSGPARLVAGEVEAVTVAASSNRVVQVPLQVECARVPPVDLDGDPSDDPQEWVDVGVDGDQRVRLPIVGQLGSLTDQLSYWCDPVYGQPVTAEALRVRDDGRLVVLAHNESRQPMVLAPDDTLGVALVADPPLGDPLGARQSIELALGLQVDCARAGGVLDLPGRVELLASADDGDPTPADGGFSVVDPETMSAWVADRVAATCG